MGSKDGRTQLRRLLDLARTLTSTTRGMRVDVLADIYQVDKTRIYDDLKILSEFYTLNKNKGFYKIEGERPPLTRRELNALTAAVSASPLSNGSPYETQIRKALTKLHRPLADFIQKKAR